LRRSGTITASIAPKLRPAGSAHHASAAAKQLMTHARANSCGESDPCSSPPRWF
jgi:hypothetical protein